MQTGERHPVARVAFRAPCICRALININHTEQCNVLVLVHKQCRKRPEKWFAKGVEVARKLSFVLRRASLERNQRGCYCCKLYLVMPGTDTQLGCGLLEVDVGICARFHLRI